MSDTKFQLSPSAALLQQLAAAGIPKGAIAKHLNIQASAVTDLYAGQRQLKYEEGVSLSKLLPFERRGRDLPLIQFEDAINWREAVAASVEHVIVPLFLVRSADFVVSLPFSVVAMPPKASFNFADSSYAVVNCFEPKLYGSMPYLVDCSGTPAIMWYLENPARLESANSSSTQEVLHFGVDDIKIIGSVDAVLQSFC